MRRSKFLSLLFLFFVLAACGCSSSNKGKIEDTKWTSEAGNVKGSSLPSGTMFLDFRRNGRLLGRIGNQDLTGKYILGWGEQVIFNLDQPVSGRKTHWETLAITGERMTMTDMDGTKLSFRKW